MTNQQNEAALLAQMAHAWDAFWTRTGGHGSTTHAWEEVLAEARAACDGSCDIALARRQVGPDGVVPGNARECAELWEKEATRHYRELQHIRTELAQLDVRLADNFMGGYGGRDLEIFRHGMETAAKAVAAVLRGERNQAWLVR
jgi:hypothetical protein